MASDDRAPRGIRGDASAAVTRFIARIGQRPVALGTLSTRGRVVATFDDERADVLVASRDARAATVGAAVPAPGDRQRRARTSARAARRSPPSSSSPRRSMGSADRPSRTPARRSSRAAPQSTSIARTARRSGDARRMHPTCFASSPSRPADSTRGIYATASYAVALDRLADRLADGNDDGLLVPPGPPAGDVRVGARIPGARVMGWAVEM